MQLFVTSLNSGSNGNCYYIGNEDEAILIDAGISCRETEKRMKRLGLSMEKVKAIFVSHEHSDHIRGIAGICKKWKLPVYITPWTLKGAKLSTTYENYQPFQAYEPVTIGDFSITAFPKYHDASDPHSFIVSSGELTVGVFTDIGAPCEHVIQHFGLCHAIFLEANYDEEMLSNGRYPYFLKQRIRGGKGHLSNQQALHLFLSCRAPFLSHVFLSHLSKDNNCPELVHSLFSQHADGTEVVVASRFEETPLYTIQAQEEKGMAIA
ncbi:MBL fold metallo-hydrolase [Nafulsella turpanensis]|uniref:MBL fold metallo-hydrolase n=1 Tax=Nafulsella turpanensis TaxID=1265690 RepID=UPI00034802BB|nr:MBL fold metallo-hydrolase [Nafulsella turpanensis]